MIKETMTREQRLITAVSLGIPDRVPVSSMFDDFALRQKGMPVVFGGDAAYLAQKMQAMHDTFDDLGGYDYQWHAGVGFPGCRWQGSCDMRVNSIRPGQDSSSVTLEKETLTFDDYDKIISRGWNGFCEEFYPRVTGLALEQIEANQHRMFKIYMEDIEWWKERGIPVTCGGLTLNCEMILSLGRTLTKFTLDMYRYPDKIQAVLEAMVDDCIQNAMATARATGIPWATILLARGSSTFYNIPTFERFVFPSLKKMVDAFNSAGLSVNFHLDTDWILNLPYFKEFPKAKCIAELDSTTDIFKAKEILGGHMCIKGDVPAPMLSLGTPDKITAYCEKLIDIVAKGGGFILGTGCTCPVDAKFENVKAMVDTAKNYYPY
jgi:hypothetical protein